jgi:ABC-type multidrug transport system fused ATPase/permease subunit
VGASVDPATPLPDGPIGIEVGDLWFTYAPDPAAESVVGPVLRGVTFDVAPGETVALVGATGSGKSTLQQLLVRLLEPTAGSIRIGGVPSSEVSPDDLRVAISLVFQETFLFAASVRDNVVIERVMGDGHDTLVADDDALLAEVADTARVARFVEQLPSGWDTVLGERGVTLSGGQRQRIALARALMRRPRVLLLDDATSAVDPIIESEILTGLRREQATLLIVAHRLSTIALADRVVFLDDGRVAGVGTHTELLAMPRYAALVHAYEVTDEPFDLDDEGVA